MRTPSALGVAIALLLAASAAFAGGIGRPAEVLDSLGLRADKPLGEGKLKPGTVIKVKVVDTSKLASHGFTGGVKNGDAMVVRVKGDKTFVVETRGAAAAKGRAAAKGAAEKSSLNVSKTFVIGEDGKLAR
jgi:hypothetical protein